MHPYLRRMVMENKKDIEELNTTTYWEGRIVVTTKGTLSSTKEVTATLDGDEKKQVSGYGLADTIGRLVIAFLSIDKATFLGGRITVNVGSKKVIATLDGDDKKQKRGGSDTEAIGRLVIAFFKR